jgi:MFS transporter, putative metabolite:H+ symporter
MEAQAHNQRAVQLGVLVAALGFFVDMYDIIIFSVVRTPSFIDLGFNKNDFSKLYDTILNFQMLGMLIGGFLWGYIGDRFGRLKVLFGSIFIYSVFNILNAFVTNETQYIACRFFAGIGLAGELGAGLTLVAEQVNKNKRGYAAAIVGAVGMLGAVAAGLMGFAKIDWKTCYLVGGGLGILLLLLRLGVLESKLFNNLQVENNKKGNFLIILKNKDYLLRFIAILMAGIPGWYSTGILIGKTNEITESMGMLEKPNIGLVTSLYFGGFACGDLLCGLLSQKLKSRKKAIYTFMAMFYIVTALVFITKGSSLTVYYILFTLMGVSVAYSIMLFTGAAEQFGTNIRSLVTSTTLNMVRAWVIPITLGTTWLATQFCTQVAQACKPNYYIAAIIMGLICMLISFVGLSRLHETFNKDLNYLA